MIKNPSTDHRPNRPGFLTANVDLLPRLLIIVAVLGLTHFPWDVDRLPTQDEQKAIKSYYADAYSLQRTTPETPEDSEYVRKAKASAEAFNIKSEVSSFIKQHGLSAKKILDIGAGRGYLQDSVADYTGLDISPAARRFFHKRFVLGSATAMPFPEDYFDGAWSIWVLEHVQNPEAGLLEMRRVLKDGGVLMLAPAWSCPPWLAEGYPVRPFSDFGIMGKLMKASIPLRTASLRLAAPPIRLARAAYWAVDRSPLRLRYRRLHPNYQKYWMGDSDAVNSLDRYETALWFMSRGDECLNCEYGWSTLPTAHHPLYIKIRKPQSPT